MVTVGGPWTKARSLYSPQAGLAHEPSDAVAATAMVLLLQFPGDARTSVGLAGLMMDGSNQREELAILELPARGWADQPGIIAAGRDLQDLA